MKMKVSLVYFSGYGYNTVYTVQSHDKNLSNYVYVLLKSSLKTLNGRYETLTPKPFPKLSKIIIRIIIMKRKQSRAYFH